MDFFIIIGKIAASVFLFAFLVAGIMKAHPRFHSPRHGPIAEYATGFIITCLASIGFYYLWW